jgi:H+/Cl- antiporter ClcA
MHGRSKYGISRTIRVLLDLMTVKFLGSYSTRPLQMFGGVGLAMGLAGTVVCAWLAFVKFVQHEGIADRPLLLLGVTMILAGIQLVMTGLLAELMSRTYHESQAKPIYVIREIREAQQPTREMAGLNS